MRPQPSVEDILAEDFKSLLELLAVCIAQIGSVFLEGPLKTFIKQKMLRFEIHYIFSTKL